VRVLLDTHVFLWSVLDSPKLREQARQEIRDAETVYVSAASIWEIALKARLGRIKGDVDKLVGAIQESGFTELSVRALHAARVTDLPGHHQDPFDRLLVAQAMTEPLVLLRADRTLTRYSELVRLI
jgi:PIN domain nuclease of toxin-antitoxin system